jgi:hypothetical protein
MYAAPALGDMCLINYEEGNGEAGNAMLRFFNDVEQPLPVVSGEFWLVHKSGFHLHSLPQFENVEEKRDAAKAKVDELSVRHAEAWETSRAGHAKASAVLQRIAVEKQSLVGAEQELSASLVMDQTNDRAQRRVRESKAKIDALTGLHATLTKEAGEIDAGLHLKSHGPYMTAAMKVLEEAELHRPIANYAMALVTIIPLARDLLARMPPQPLGADLGYILSPRHATIGIYQVNDDGSLHFGLS